MPSRSTKSPTFSQCCATSWQAAASGLNWGLSEWKTPCCWDTVREWKRSRKKELYSKPASAARDAVPVYLSAHLGIHIFLSFPFPALAINHDASCRLPLKIKTYCLNIVFISYCYFCSETHLSSFNNEWHFQQIFSQFQGLCLNAVTAARSLLQGLLIVRRSHPT